MPTELPTRRRADRFLRDLPRDLVLAVGLLVATGLMTLAERVAPASPLPPADELRRRWYDARVWLAAQSAAFVRWLVPEL